MLGSVGAGADLGGAPGSRFQILFFLQGSHRTAGGAGDSPGPWTERPAGSGGGVAPVTGRRLVLQGLESWASAVEGDGHVHSVTLSLTTFRPPYGRELRGPHGCLLRPLSKSLKVAGAQATGRDGSTACGRGSGAGGRANRACVWTAPCSR